MLEWQSIIEVGAKSILPKIIEAALKSASNDFVALRPYRTLKFDRHLKNSYEICKSMKTIFSGNKGVPLLQNYVPTNFSHRTENFDEYSFIDEIWSRKKVCILGAAGSGKSMFMRYFWISCSIEPRGKIPIFLELRDFNVGDDQDFVSFIVRAVFGTGRTELTQIFERALSEGQFVFILDAFDEVKHEKRIYIERFLHQYSDSENIIVISSRRNDLIEANGTVDIFEVSPLSLKYAIKLIKKIDFDRKVKANFVRSLKSGMFKTHNSFASRPLLLTMMLLSFEQYADVPSKMHIFYDQSFDVLYSRHDALKETFSREKKSGLTIDRFKSVFSFFCLLTYAERINEFTRSKALEYINKASKFSGDKFEPDDFFEDLLETVNVIHRDGLKFVFSHRSFQEYFAAYCILRIGERQARKIMLNISDRVTDNVFPMMYDINKNFVERVYIDQFNEEYRAKTECSESFNIRKYIIALNMAIVISPTLARPSKTNSDIRTHESNQGAIVCAMTAGDQLSYARFIVYRLMKEGLAQQSSDVAMVTDISVEHADLTEIREILQELDSYRFFELGSFTLFLYGNEISLMGKNGPTGDFDQKSLSLDNNDSIREKFFNYVNGLDFARKIERKHQEILNIFSKVRTDIKNHSANLDEILIDHG